jgi:exopolysaccharide biosynthesis WecB/TagA/CpsF family protein
MPVLWAARLLGRPVPEKVSGSDLVLPLLERAAREGLGVYFLGGAEGAAEKAAERLRARLPELLVVGTDAPWLDANATDEQLQPVVERILAARPEIVLVAFGAPKQELLSDRLAPLVRPAVLIGVGASIDFIAGMQRRAPAWMSRSGLEWAYRLATEPRRMWRRYLVRDPKFLVVLARELIFPAAVLALAASMGGLGACSSAPAPPACDLDPALTLAECTTLRSFALPAELPASQNPKAEDPKAASLGFRIFFDARFSSNLLVRCATCHLPERKFADGKPTSTGLETVVRNSPTVLDAARYPMLFWDGRASDLSVQPLFAFENPHEMDFTRLEIAHRVKTSYAADYEALFGPLPPLDDAVRFPARGKPGDPAWDAMAQVDRDDVDAVARNVGRAIEAYERKLAAGLSAFDRFLAGNATALDAKQRRGMVVTLRAGCLADCHTGPAMGGTVFSNLGVPAWPNIDPDRGRAAVVPSPQPSDLGAVRTPSLRNVSASAPYMHNGRYPTLEETVRFHASGGGRGQSGFVGDVDARLVPRTLTDDDVTMIVAFLGALDGDYPLPPWNNWPQK